MHRSQKSHIQPKKVPPPTLPGDQQLHTQEKIPLYGSEVIIINTSSIQTDDIIFLNNMVSSPSLEEGGFDLPRETSVALRNKDEIKDSRSKISADISKVAVKIKPTVSGAINLLQSTTNNPFLGGCAPAIVACPSPVFCATLREPLTHKAAVYYHQQLALQEDLGIDLTQSPGRDSPGSSSGSAGSGSRHSTASLDSGRASSYFTGTSGASIRSSGGGALTSPRCSSLSSCSIGSVDRQRNDELIIDWLIEIKYEEYAQQFLSAGYDLPTIVRMTPEDLTAIGIKNPQHRECIKQRIDKLQVLDNLPHFVPGSIEEWLQLLRLEDYIQPLLDQNYKTVRDVTQVTWEDLEDIGIVKLGHQKKILLAIKRVKDIISGKCNPSGPTTFYQAQVRQPRGKSLESLTDIHDNSTRSHLTFRRYNTTDYSHTVLLAQAQQPCTTTLQHHQLHQHKNLEQQNTINMLGNGNCVISIEATRDWRRSYDDGDITPTNDGGKDNTYEDGGGTLPRQQRGMSHRAMLHSIPSFEQHHYMNAAAAEYACRSAGLTGTNVFGAINSSKFSDTFTVDSMTAPYMIDGPSNQKKIAPEPPRRHCSIRNSRQLGSNVHKSNQEQPSQSVNVENKYYDTTPEEAGQLSSLNQFQGVEDFSQRLQTKQPIYANFATIQQTTAEIHNEKYQDNKSNSSIDSIDNIPFANENTGTIKQRLLIRQEMNAHNPQIIQPQQSTHHLHSSSSSATTIGNITHSLKSSASLHDATLISRSDSMGFNTCSCSTTASTCNLLNLRSPLKNPPVTQEKQLVIKNTPSTYGDSNPIGEEAVSGIATTIDKADNAVSANASRVSANVLNDIGNMLANLSDELDAMLEEEKRVGLNIDSE